MTMTKHLLLVGLNKILFLFLFLQIICQFTKSWLFKFGKFGIIAVFIFNFRLNNVTLIWNPSLYDNTTWLMISDNVFWTPGINLITTYFS